MGYGIAEKGPFFILRTLYVMLMFMTFITTYSYTEITTGSANLFTWSRVGISLVVPLILIILLILVLSIIVIVTMLYDKSVEAKKLKNQE